MLVASLGAPEGEAEFIVLTSKGLPCEVVSDVVRADDLGQVRRPIPQHYVVAAPVSPDGVEDPPEGPAPCVGEAGRGEGGIDLRGRNGGPVRGASVGGAIPVDPERDQVGAQQRSKGGVSPGIGERVAGTSARLVFHPSPKKRQRALLGGCCQRFGFAAPYLPGCSDCCVVSPRSSQKVLNGIEKSGWVLRRGHRSRAPAMRMEVEESRLA
jgi:hypothetical protein